MSHTTSFQLAMIQMSVVGGELERNLDHAVARIAEAAAEGAELLLLPECLDLGWTHPSAREQAGTIPGGWAYERLREAAVQHQVYVCAGLSEAHEEQVYNAAVFISPRGELLLTHRKLNELDIAHDLYAQGDRLQVAETPWGRIGVMICADAFAKDHMLARSLGYMGADVILSPSSWAVPPEHDPEKTPYGAEWRKAYGRVAKEFSLPIFGVSNVGAVSAGPWQGWNCIGCSLAVDAEGSPQVQGSYGVEAEEILYTQVDLLPRPARGNCWASR